MILYALLINTKGNKLREAVYKGMEYRSGAAAVNAFKSSLMEDLADRDISMNDLNVSVIQPLLRAINITTNDITAFVPIQERLQRLFATQEADLGSATTIRPPTP